MESNTRHKSERRGSSGAAQSASLAPVLLGATYPLPLFKSITGLDNWALRQARRNGLRVVKVGRRHFVRAQTLTPFWQRSQTARADSVACQSAGCDPVHWDAASGSFPSCELCHAIPQSLPHFRPEQSREIQAIEESD